MLQAVLVSLLLAPLGQIQLARVRPTYGTLGPPRPDWKVPLGDVLYVSMDISGLKANRRGRVLFGISMQVTDQFGKVHYDSGRVDTISADLLGTGTIRDVVHINTGLDQKPGPYNLKLTVADAEGNKETSITLPFEVLPLEFRLVRFQMSYDRSGKVPAPCVATVGQTVYVHFVIVGFDRDRRNNNFGAVAVQLHLADETGKTLSTRPLTGDVKDIPPGTDFLPLRLELPVQRAGRFRIILSATDLVNRKTTKLSVPFLAVEHRCRTETGPVPPCAESGEGPVSKFLRQRGGAVASVPTSAPKGRQTWTHSSKSASPSFARWPTTIRKTNWAISVWARR